MFNLNDIAELVYDLDDLQRAEVLNNKENEINAKARELKRYIAALSPLETPTRQQVLSSWKEYANAVLFSYAPISGKESTQTEHLLRQFTSAR